MGLFDKIQKKINDTSEAIIKKSEELANIDWEEKNQMLINKLDKRSKEIFEKSSELDEVNNCISRKEINPADIDNLQRVPATKSYSEAIWFEFYNDYYEKPYISKDREINTNWIEQARIRPSQFVIPKEKLTRFEDGLLPGHVYMLYWLGKKKKGRIPTYFEYKYGIDFIKEKAFLHAQEYIDDNNELTEKGIESLVRHYSVIDEHSLQRASERKAVRKYAESEKICVNQEKKEEKFKVSDVHEISSRPLMVVDKSDRVVVERDIELLNNELLVKIKEVLEVSMPLKIPTLLLYYNDDFEDKLGTYFQYEPLTSNGRASKYPYTLYYAIGNHFDSDAVFDTFGDIGYLQDGRIGKAHLNFWQNKIGYHINMLIVDDKLAVNKVEKMDGKGKTVIYKK